MAFENKRFVNPTTLTTSASSALYTVPAQYTGIIKQLVVTNTTASPRTFSFFIGSVASASTALFSATSVAANDAIVINLSQVLNAGDNIFASADAGSALNLTVSGVLNAGPLDPLSTYIADGAVTTAKMADLSVTTGKIANNAVTQSKMASNLSGATIVTSSTRSTLIPSPFTGQICFETDTGYLRVWDGAAWDYLSTWQATIPGAWQSYTPTWTNLTVGNGTQEFKYTQINKFVHVFGRITFGSTTSISTVPRMTLPVSRPNGQLSILGTAILGDTGTGTYAGYPLSDAAGSVLIFRMDHTVGSTVLEGNPSATSPFTWVSGDFINVNLMYEAA
jgi:hypothetical protein